MISIPATCDSASSDIHTDSYRAPCRLSCRRSSIGTLLLRRNVPCRTSGMYVDNAATARFNLSYVILGWVVSCMSTCRSAYLIPSRRAALLVSLASTFPSTSYSSQMVSNFTIKSADSSAKLNWRSRSCVPIKVAQAAHPVHVLHTCVPASAKLSCRRGCRRARIVHR